MYKKQLYRLYQRFLKLARTLSPLLLLIVRLMVANVFWKSGLVKIHDFGATIDLFQNEYHVPLLPPVVAAYMGTFFELTCSVLLAIGLASRLATLPLLVMTAVIQFTYDQNIQHAYWAILLGTIFTQGAGKFSLDYAIKHRLERKAVI